MEYWPSCSVRSSTFHNLSYSHNTSGMFEIGGSKLRRHSRSPAAAKYRRTRTGCYKCRVRRVKCDEARPVCTRCQNGGYECIFPDLEKEKEYRRQNRLKANSRAAVVEVPPSAREDEESCCSAEEGTELATMPSEHEPGFAAANRYEMGEFSSDLFSNSPITDDRWSSSDFSDWGLTASTGLVYGTPPISESYPVIFCPQRSRHHFEMIYETNDCTHALLCLLAGENKALRLAVDAYECYQESKEDSTRDLSPFFVLYNESILLLMEILQRDSSPSISTLLTILQLASIEAYLGDWVNLKGHQRAAFVILAQIFQPQTVMLSPVGRLALYWCSRLDLCLWHERPLEVVIPREWLLAEVEFYREQCEAEPSKVKWKIHLSNIHLRLIACDMATLQRSSPGISSMPTPATIHEDNRITTRLFEWKNIRDEIGVESCHAVDPASSLSRAGDNQDSCAAADLPFLSAALVDAEWSAIMQAHLSQHPNATRESI